MRDDHRSDEEALADTGEDWQTVSLPHTWHAEAAASLRTQGDTRGRGFYRTEFDTPSAGARHWLEISAASLVADVWLNGQKLGRHRGGVSQLRFDVTDALAPDGTNELLVKVDNGKCGLYRHAALISTPAAAHFELDDLGVSATTTAVTNGTATINVRAKLAHEAEGGDLVVRVSLVDDAGRVAATTEAPVKLEGTTGSDGAQSAEVEQELSVPAAHLWQGSADPYLYQLVAELVGAAGEPVDRVAQPFGIRTLRFDPDEGFFLNGRRVRLNGVALHQDFLAWATSEEDMDASLALIAEMGGNAIRLGHYPFTRYALERASALGFVVWVENASELRTEPGVGAALTHHTDNVLGGPPELRSAGDGDVSFQPEEYQAHVHERNHELLASKPDPWGTFVWNMFDFGSDHRNEGDVLGVNTKGLVTFDRQTRKDAFFFYKANWSSAPTTYITSRRYTDRAYPLADVKVYSNADSVDLSVNGKPFAMMTAADCAQRTCVFEDVPLSLGANTLTAVGDHAGKPAADTVEWSLASKDINIAAGRLATGLVSSQGTRFGSDNFFVGGDGVYIERGEDRRGGVPNDITGTDDPLLYEYFREGAFSYELPLADGSYEVTLGFLEPDEDMALGERVFDVTANEVMLLQDLDVLSEAGAPRDVFTRTFTVDVSRGRLVLDFAPTEGEALVSTIEVRAAATAGAE